MWLRVTLPLQWDYFDDSDDENEALPPPPPPDGPEFKEMERDMCVARPSCT